MQSTRDKGTETDKYIQLRSDFFDLRPHGDSLEVIARRNNLSSFWMSPAVTGGGDSIIHMENRFAE